MKISNWDLEGFPTTDEEYHQYEQERKENERRLKEKAYEEFSFLNVLKKLARLAGHLSVATGATTVAALLLLHVSTPEVVAYAYDLNAWGRFFAIPLIIIVVCGITTVIHASVEEYVCDRIKDRDWWIQFAREARQMHMTIEEYIEWSKS